MIPNFGELTLALSFPAQVASATIPVKVRDLPLGNSAGLPIFYFTISQDSEDLFCSQTLRQVMDGVGGGNTNNTNPILFKKLTLYNHENLPKGDYFTPLFDIKRRGPGNEYGIIEGPTANQYYDYSSVADNIEEEKDEIDPADPLQPLVYLVPLRKDYAMFNTASEETKLVPSKLKFELRGTFDNETGDENECLVLCPFEVKISFKIKLDISRTIEHRFLVLINDLENQLEGNPIKED